MTRTKENVIAVVGIILLIAAGFFYRSEEDEILRRDSKIDKKEFEIEYILDSMPQAAPVLRSADTEYEENKPEAQLPSQRNDR